MEEKEKESTVAPVKVKKTNLLPTAISITVILLLLVLGLQVYIIMQMSQASKIIDISTDSNISNDITAEVSSPVNTSTKRPLVQIEDIEPVSIVTEGIYTLAADSLGNHYTMRLSIQLGFNSKSKEYTKKRELIESKLPIANDVIDSVIRNRTYDDVQKENFAEDLKKELVRKLNEKFDTDVIVDIYFYDFYVQIIKK